MTKTLEYSHKDFKEATIKKMLQKAKTNTLETYEKIENLRQEKGDLFKKEKKRTKWKFWNQKT